MIRKTLKMFLVALIAAFALGSIAEAAPRKPVRHRTTATRSTTRSAVMKKSAARKHAPAKRKSTTRAKKSPVKRKPSTKPR